MKPPLLIKMTTPVGEPIEIPIHDFGPKNKNPKVVLVSGIHGNELNGIFVLARLADFLRKLAEQNGSADIFSERILLVPAVNVLGLHVRTRSWPVDRTDLNRMFPGYNLGETTQRIAAALINTTHSAEVCVDIHASNLEFEELPQVRLYGSSEEERKVAGYLGLPAMIECPVNKISTTTLLHAWKECGGHNFVIQAGVAGHLQMSHCDRLYYALIRFLKRLKVFSHPAMNNGDMDDTADETAYFPLNRTVSLISKKAGLFVPKVEVGRWVEKAALLGFIYDGFDGRIRSRIKAPRAGFLTGLRYQALIYEGDLLARIQVDSDVKEGADTYLIGQGQ